MKRPGPVLVAALALLLAACGPAARPAAPDFARLPPGAFGAGRNGDVAVADLAQRAFEDAGRTYGRPAEAARAAAALEYMAGAPYVSPGWSGVSLLARDQLDAARTELRRVLGVRPGARSQQVVDGLLAAAGALDGGDEAAAAGALDRSGAFARPGAEEVQLLANLPYMRIANLATRHAADELSGNDTEFRHF